MVAGTPRRVLDVGCSDGSLAIAFKERGAETWGIEIDPRFAATAAGRLDSVLAGDALEHVRGLQAGGERFDLVICADSLEHMPDPDAVLDAVRALVAPGGQCVVSLPNVRFYTTLTNLVFRGRWPRLDRGVHDRTHLRWFTDADARDMFATAGFAVEDVMTHYRLVDSKNWKTNRWAQYLAFGPWAPFMAYQYVYRLRPV
jgi:methionine biosynthesis protein MetW